MKPVGVLCVIESKPGRKGAVLIEQLPVTHEAKYSPDHHDEHNKASVRKVLHPLVKSVLELCIACGEYGHGNAGGVFEIRKVFAIN